MDCEICIGYADGISLDPDDERHCMHCGEIMNHHEWSAHPHQLFKQYRDRAKPCPGWSEVLDDSFED